MSQIISNFAAKLLAVKMFSKFFSRLCLLVFGIQIIVISIFNTWFNPAWSATKNMLISGLKISFKLFTDIEFSVGAKILSNTLSGFFELQSFVLYRSLWVWILIPIILLYISLFDENEDTGKEFIQGREFLTPLQLNNIIHNFSKLSLFKVLSLRDKIPFGQVYLPRQEEIKQTFIVGKTGVGKTNLFNYAIKKVRDRKEKIIIHDYKGDYVEKFYNPQRGDILFNPLDTRSVGWCLFNDCSSVLDIDAFAYGLIPEVSANSEPFWNNASRDILIGILHYCFINNKKTNKDIWATATLSNQELFELLKDTKGGELGAKHLEDPIGKTAMSIMSTLMQYMKIFEYMSSMKGDFSIRNWVKGHSIGSIFITNYASLQNILRPIISVFIQTVGRVLLSQGDDINGRLFFFLDEFGQLPNMNTIKDLMTASRSKGGSIFLGVQDIGQIDKIYKKETRSTILNSASNRVIFNCRDYETAKFLSLDIGETEYFENSSSKSLNMGDSDKVNTSKLRRKEYLVTTEDIQSLPDLNAFVSIGHHNITLSKWKYLKLKSINSPFIQRPELNLATNDDEIITEREIFNVECN